ncbi:hypothetical protein OH76DRAFT_1420249 [Lentinus brumalis]|uniref:Uncharacterized protein n=1 Tax=Lentinus brumalis TaxID=2498619 RepID=A0A371D1D1_9APHY|nr:hypothetical protein OH76DRAFT_1420249 [Polyporus brumalis]
MSPRHDLVESLLYGPSFHNQLAGRFAATDRPTSLKYIKAAAEFKAFTDEIHANFQRAIEHAQDRERNGGTMALEEDEDIEQVELKAPPKQSSNHLDFCRLPETLEQRIMDLCESRLTRGIVPDLHRKFEAHFEEHVVPDLETRVLKRLEIRVGRYTANHPMLKTLCSTLRRKMTEQMAQDIELRIFPRLLEDLYGRLSDRFGITKLLEDLYSRLLARFSNQASESSMSPTAEAFEAEAFEAEDNTDQFNMS